MTTQLLISPSDKIGNASFGCCMAMSSDGTTAAIGGLTDNSTAGAVWVFTRSAGNWTQQGSKLVGYSPIGASYFGTSVALSADGSTMIVGGRGDNSWAGAAWIFKRSNTGEWSQVQKLTGTGAFGSSVALSYHGDVALIGGSRDARGTGAAWIYTCQDKTWSTTPIKLNSPDQNIKSFGISVDLSADGTTALIGASGIGNAVGAAWIFKKSVAQTGHPAVWSQSATKLPDRSDRGNNYGFGISVSLSADGNVALVGSFGNASAPSQAGAWVFTNTGASWTQQGPKLIAPNPYLFGQSVSLSANGQTAVISDWNMSTGGIGWIFQLNAGVWTIQNQNITGQTKPYSGYAAGGSVAISADAKTFLSSGYDQDIDGIARSLSNFEVWGHHHHITSRSALCEENLRGGKTKSVYRTSITLPLVTKSLTISASENCTVEIEDKEVVLTANTPVTVTPNFLSKLQLSITATDVRCPTFKLQANWMDSNHFHYLLPDVEYHKRVAKLSPDALSSASNDVKTQLGVSGFSNSHLDDLQKTIQSVSTTVQHTYNATDHGVHRDRGLLPKNMKDPHFKLDFEGSKPAYSALTKEQVKSELDSHTVTTPEASSFFSLIENDISSVTKIMVHTVKDAAKDIIETGVDVGSSIGHTVLKVGEDIVHGDLNYANQDLIAGGESVKGKLVHGGGKLVGEAIEGAGQLLVLTVHTDEKIVQYVISHTGEIGKLIGIVLKKAGVELQSFINWLLDKLDWDAIKVNHTKFKTVITKKIDEISGLVSLYQSDADAMLDSFVKRFEKDISPTLNNLDGKKISNKPFISPSHSVAVEQLEWFLGKLARSSAEYAYPVLTAIVEDVVSSLANGMEKALGKDGDRLWAAIKEAGLHDLQAIFTHPGHTFDYIVDVFIKLAKAGAVLAIDMIKQILDGFMKAMITLLDGFKKSIEKPWNIPFIEDLYTTFLKPNGTMSMLDLTCLLIAVPVTVTAKSYEVPNEGLFGRQTRAPLAPLKKPGWGWGYGACHMILGVITPIADVRTLCANLGGDLNREFNASATELNPRLTTKAKKAIDPGLQTLTILVGFVAQLTTNPIPPDEIYVLPPSATRNDIYESPNYMSHVIFAYQWIGWGLGSIAGLSGMIAGFAKSEKWEKYFNRAGSVFNCAFGLGHFILMALLDHRDRIKADSINYCYKNVSGFATMEPLDFYNALQSSVPALADGHISSHSFTSNTDQTLIDWVAAIKNYHVWSNLPADGGIPVKGFGNIMDTFPELGQIASYPDLVKDSKGYSMIGTLVFDVFGHMGEGITVMVRTGRNEML